MPPKAARPPKKGGKKDLEAKEKKARLSYFQKSEIFENYLSKKLAS